MPLNGDCMLKISNIIGLIIPNLMMYKWNDVSSVFKDFVLMMYQIFCLIM